MTKLFASHTSIFLKKLESIILRFSFLTCGCVADVYVFVLKQIE